MTSPKLLHNIPTYVKLILIPTYPKNTPPRLKLTKIESFKSCLLLLVAPPGLTETLAQLMAWRSLLWLPMTWRWRYLKQSNFLSTTSLAWSLALHLLFCFSQEKPLQWKEINTNTHTHTHTHTHTNLCKLLCISVRLVQDCKAGRTESNPSPRRKYEFKTPKWK